MKKILISWSYNHMLMAVCVTLCVVVLFLTMARQVSAYSIAHVIDAGTSYGHIADTWGGTPPGGGTTPAPGGGITPPGGGGDTPPGGGGVTPPSELKNPFKSKSIQEFLLKIIEILLIFAVPIIVFFIVYGGFLLVTARGDEGQVTTGRNTITWAVIGGVIVLGAELIITVIQGTVESL